MSQHENSLNSDAEEFISVMLLHESLSAGAQMKRQQLEKRLKLLTQQTKPDIDVDGQEVYDDVREDDTNGEFVLKNLFFLLAKYKENFLQGGGGNPRINYRG